MRTTAKILSALLSYPTEELRSALPELLDALCADAALPAATARGVARLIAALEAGDLLDRQEEYVRLFDRTRSLALNLFEHVHGDGRDRGPAMVSLRQIYDRNGAMLAQAELPDYLPIMLEFAALAPEAGLPLLADAAPVIDSIRAKLDARGSAYAGALAAVLALTGKEARATATAADSAEATPEEIDRAWEDAPVTFGPDSDPAREAAAAAQGGAQADAACGIAGIIARMKAAKGAAPATPRPHAR
ncbi:MAG: nitrate reductase molybdenum cofactor assembly chaperone [Alphaproteobacteria bacterium]|nr:nitrate reductase molybdenum cofactor assembly chaperone [Alphaproteobacteria bacterium]